MRKIRRYSRVIFEQIEKYGPIANAFLTSLFFVIGFVVTYLFSQEYSPSIFATQLMVTITSGVCSYWIAKKSRNNSVISELTISYIIQGRRGLLDTLLGKLISGTWRRNEIYPADALFRLIDLEVGSGDYWVRRRVSEAIPMLSELDPKRSLELSLRLRADWSDAWKGDIRRRVVEALTNDMGKKIDPLIAKIKKDKAFEIISLRDKDEIYTAIASMEVLSTWKLKSEQADSYMSEFLNVAQKRFSSSEIEALNWTRNLLTAGSKGSSAQDIFGLLHAGIRDTNELLRIAAVRNLLLSSARFPSAIFDLMQGIADDTSNISRNVRRPLAREATVRFVMDHAAAGPHSAKARKLLECLALTDPEKIIRTTTFDEIEYLAEKNLDYAKSLCLKVSANEDETELKGRAERVLHDIERGRTLQHAS